jgi:nicotinate-nucleotide adenylyltransferase
MVRAAVAGDPRFAADDLELRRQGPSYTVDTLRELRAREPGAELFFITGADILGELHRWREPDEVLRLATLVVVSRAGEALAPAGGVAARAVEITRVDVSSTQVRRLAAAGKSIRYLVPDAVRAVVERERLYRDLSH